MTNPVTQPRCAIYIRVSMAEQLEGHSLDAQREVCVQVAESRGWKVVKIFEGEGESAKNDKRKAFQALVKYIREGNADVLLTHKVDRYARNVMDALNYLAEFNKAGCTYVSATEQFDFSTPWGRTMLVMLLAFAEMFIHNLRAETTKGKRQRASKGYWNGDLSFGYKTGPVGPEGKPVAEPDPATAPGVRLAFTKYVTGLFNDLEIAKMLNAAGYRTKGKRGSIPFSKDSVRSLLQNEFYSGVVKYKKETFRGNHQAIISQELFDQAQAVRRRNQLAPRKVSSKHRVYPLAGLIFCADCKRNLSGQFINDKRYYRDRDRDYDGHCPSKTPYLPADGIEQMAADLLMSVKLPEEWKAQIRAQSVGARSPDDVRRRKVRADAKIQRAKELYLEQALTRDQYDRTVKEAQAELDSLKPVPQPDLEQVGELLNDLPRLWKLATPEERKTLFQAMLERVYVRGEEVIALQPRSELYPLLLVSGGPDEIRAASSLKLTRAHHPTPLYIPIIPPATPSSRLAAFL